MNDMTADDAKARVKAYLDRRVSAKGFDRDEIHTFDAGCEGHTVLLSGDLTALLADLAAKDAEIARLRTITAVQVAVKPLEWEIVPTGYGPETYEAYAETGFYQVFTDEDSCCGAVFAEFATNRDQFGTTAARGVARVNSFADAKAAAQADYEARIRSALTAVPSPDVAGLAEALQSALNFIQNTESEMGVILGCGYKARAALAKLKGGA